MRRPAIGRDQRGLTLIELVLAVSIMAIAGTIVTAALTTALRAWQGGFEHGREELVARIVLERLGAQLRSAVASPAKRGEEAAVAFEATADSLRFVTLDAAGAAPLQVSYALDDRHRLLYQELPWPDKEFFSAGKPRREESVPEVQGFAVSVTKRTAKKNEVPGAVSAEWTALDKELPGSVSIEIQVATGTAAQRRSYKLTVPLPTQAAP